MILNHINHYLFVLNVFKLTYYFILTIIKNPEPYTMLN